MSRFDYRDPGTDETYCHGLSPDAEHSARAPSHVATADDPILRRLVELRAQRRSIVTELRALKIRAKTGRCGVCGREFTRTRITKRRCSPTCDRQARRMRHPPQRVEDERLVREALPLLDAAHVLSPRTLAVVTRIVGGEMTRRSIAEDLGLSRQTVSQMMRRAVDLSRVAEFAVQHAQREAPRPA